MANRHPDQQAVQERFQALGIATETLAMAERCINSAPDGASRDTAKAIQKAARAHLDAAYAFYDAQDAERGIRAAGGWRQVSSPALSADELERLVDGPASVSEMTPEELRRAMENRKPLG